MTDKLTTAQKYRVIDCVRENDFIWNPHNPLYKDISCKKRFFQKIKQELQLGHDVDVKEVWNMLRNQYKREKNKQAASGVSHFPPRWHFFSRLAFLDRVDSLRSEQSESPTILPLMLPHTVFEVDAVAAHSSSFDIKAESTSEEHGLGDEIRWGEQSAVMVEEDVDCEFNPSSPSEEILSKGPAKKARMTSELTVGRICATGAAVSGGAEEDDFFASYVSACLKNMNDYPLIKADCRQAIFTAITTAQKRTVEQRHATGGDLCD